VDESCIKRKQEADIILELQVMKGWRKSNWLNMVDWEDLVNTLFNKYCKFLVSRSCYHYSRPVKSVHSIVSNLVSKVDD
jgi:hypothetical protein